MITSPITRMLDGLKQVHGTTKTYVLNYMELLLKVLLSGEEFYDKMITPFVMNSRLHHVGMSWMIS